MGQLVQPLSPAYAQLKERIAEDQKVHQKKNCPTHFCPAATKPTAHFTTKPFAGLTLKNIKITNTAYAENSVNL